MSVPIWLILFLLLGVLLLMALLDHMDERHRLQRDREMWLAEIDED